MKKFPPRKRSRQSGKNYATYEKLEAKKMLAAVGTLTELQPVGLSTDAQEFGTQTAISGDFAAVSQESSFRDVGFPVYIYQRDDAGTPDGSDDTWSLFDEIAAPDPLEEGFGQSLEMDGNTLIIGSQTGFYSYEFDGAAWNQVQRIDQPNDNSFRFSDEIDLDGDKLAVSSYVDNVNGLTNAGAVYLYDRTANGWELAQSIVGTETGQGLGFEVALAGNVLAIHQIPAFGATTAQREVQFYYRDFVGDYVLEDSVPATSGVTIEAAQFDQILVLTPGTTSTLTTYQRPRGGGWFEGPSYTGSTWRNVVVDNQVMLVGSSSRDVVFTRTGLGSDWTEVSTIRSSRTVGDEFAAIDDGTIIRGYPDDNSTSIASGSVDFHFVDVAAGAVTQTQSQVSPPAVEESGSIAGDGFGEKTAMGGSFAAVSAPDRFSFQGGGLVSVYSLNDQDTIDAGDDTYSFAYSIAPDSPTPFEAFGKAVAAQGDELFIQSRNSIFVYEIGPDSATLQQVIPLAESTFVGSMKIEGDRLVASTGNDMLSIFDRIGGTWTQTSSLTMASSTAPFDFSGDTIVVARRSTTNDNDVYQLQGDSWALVETFVPFDRSGTTNIRRIRFDGNRLAVNYGATINTYTFDGSTFTPEGSIRSGFTSFELIDDVLVYARVNGASNAVEFLTAGWDSSIGEWGVSNQITTSTIDDLTTVIGEVATNGKQVVYGLDTIQNRTGTAYTFGLTNQAVIGVDREFSVAEDAALGSVVGQIAPLGETELDVEDRDDLTYTFTAGDTGAFAIDNLGVITVADPSQLDFETGLQSFSLQYEVSDGETSATATVQIQVADVTEPEIIGGLMESVSEDATSVNDGVIYRRSDNTFGALAPTTASGTYGDFTLGSDGAWSYVLNANAQTLPAGQNGQDSFDIFSADGLASNTVTITVIGENDSASITDPQGGPVVGNLNEDSTSPATGLIVVTDVDDQEAEIVPGTFVGGFGDLTITADGLWSFSLDNSAVQILNAGDTGTASFAIESVDGTQSQLSVFITGNNDAPVIGGTNTGTTDEDSTAPVTGSLTISDVDDGEARFATQSDIAGAWGTFSVDASGQWSYVLDNASVADLNDGESVTDSFTVTSFDGSGSVVVSIAIEGADEDVDVTIPGVIEDIEELVGDGDLGNGQANPIINDLRNAEKDIAKGKIDKAIEKLEAARDRVLDLFNDGDLDADDADQLIASIDALIGSLL